MIIVLLGLSFAVLKLGWSALEVYRARRALDAYLEQAQPLLDEFADATQLAGRTPRVSLAPIVGDLQRIKREFEKIEPPPVAEEAHKYYCEGMDYGIRAHLTFMAQGSDWTVNRLLVQGSDAFNNGTTAIGKLREELEQWPRFLFPSR